MLCVSEVRNLDTKEDVPEVREAEERSAAHPVAVLTASARAMRALLTERNNYYSAVNLYDDGSYLPRRDPGPLRRERNSLPQPALRERIGCGRSWLRGEWVVRGRKSECRSSRVTRAGL